MTSIRPLFQGGRRRGELNGAEPGVVHAVFCHDYARVFTRRSADDGATFTEPREITDVFEALRVDYPWRVCATGPGHGLRLRSGRMVVPVWMSDGSGTEFGAGKLGHRPSSVASRTLW